MSQETEKITREYLRSILSKKSAIIINKKDVRNKNYSINFYVRSGAYLDKNKTDITEHVYFLLDGESHLISFLCPECLLVVLALKIYKENMPPWLLSKKMIIPFQVFE